MSALDTWMPLYIGDYLQDTQDLTIEQSGAYLHLLMRYWISGPLPDDDGRLAAICRVPRTYFVRHIGPSVRAYFQSKDGRLHQGRADREREKREKISEKRAENGRKSSRKFPVNSDDIFNEINGIREANGGAKDTLQPPTSTSTSTSTKKEDRVESPIIPRVEPKKRAAPKGAELLNGSLIVFEQFWEAYPPRVVGNKIVKVGKKEARAEFARAIITTPAQSILDAVKIFPFPENRAYVKDACRWLKGESYLAEIGSAPLPSLFSTHQPERRKTADENRSDIIRMFRDMEPPPVDEFAGETITGHLED